MSVIIVSTNKGYNFLTENKDELELEERNYDEAIEGNSQLRAPAKLTKKQKLFKKYYIKYGFKKAYLKTTKYARIKRKLKDILKRGIKEHGEI